MLQPRSDEPEGARPQACPTLSVVVVSEREADTLARALEALTPACRELGATALVVRAAGAPELAPEMRLDDVELLRAPAGLSTAELRSYGMARAAGDIVILVEDRQAIGRDWHDILLRRAGAMTGPRPDIS